MRINLLNLGFFLLAIGAVVSIFMAWLNIYTGDPYYRQVAIYSIVLFGVGGGLMGLAALKKKK